MWSRPQPPMGARERSPLEYLHYGMLLATARGDRDGLIRPAPGACGRWSAHDFIAADARGSRGPGQASETLSAGDPLRPPETSEARLTFRSGQSRRPLHVPAHAPLAGGGTCWRGAERRSSCLRRLGITGLFDVAA